MLHRVTVKTTCQPEGGKKRGIEEVVYCGEDATEARSACSSAIRQMFGRSDQQAIKEEFEKELAQMFGMFGSHPSGGPV